MRLKILSFTAESPSTLSLPGLGCTLGWPAAVWNRQSCRNPGPGLDFCSKSHGSSVTDQQEPRDTPELRCGDGAVCGRKNPKNCTESLPWLPLLHSRCALHPSITATWWLYSPTRANGLFLYFTSSWGPSLWTGSRTRKGLIHSHWCSVLNPPQTKQNKWQEIRQAHLWQYLQQ